MNYYLLQDTLSPKSRMSPTWSARDHPSFLDLRFLKYSFFQKHAWIRRYTTLFHAGSDHFGILSSVWRVFKHMRRSLFLSESSHSEHLKHHRATKNLSIFICHTKIYGHIVRSSNMHKNMMHKKKSVIFATWSYPSSKSNIKDR